mgnify:CR=1 FL=1
MSAVDSGVRVTDAWTAAISSATVAAGRCAAAMAPSESFFDVDYVRGRLALVS